MSYLQELEKEHDKQRTRSYLRDQFDKVIDSASKSEFKPTIKVFSGDHISHHIPLSVENIKVIKALLIGSV